jgi:hypothetical protein
MEDEVSSPAQKALRINIDGTKYGTFAEIGAGQEVGRFFFRASGAAGTVAKTISAYDMAVSDAIYGPAGRYVSRQRLQCMLQYEFDHLLVVAAEACRTVHRAQRIGSKTLWQTDNTKSQFFSDRDLSLIKGEQVSAGNQHARSHMQQIERS